MLLVFLNFLRCLPETKNINMMKRSLSLNILQLVKFPFRYSGGHCLFKLYNIISKYKANVGSLKYIQI